MRSRSRAERSRRVESRRVERRRVERRRVESRRVERSPVESSRVGRGRAEGNWAERIGAERYGAERGSVTAEFAMVLPAVAFVLAASLACLQVAGEQLRLQDAVADTARSLGRAEPASAALLERAMPGAVLEVRRRGNLVCAIASAPSSVGGGLLSALVVRASACALDGGR